MAKNTLTTAFDQTEEALKHPIPVRAYKDRIFRMIFKEKRALLALYNAMNDWGVALPQFADVLGIFLLRQAMRGIPKALIEAARMEGIGSLKIMRDIILPLVRPSILTTGIIFFINSWNEYVWPVLILKSKENYTLSLALQMYISAEGGTEFTIAMAVSVITMIIPLALYLIFQRYIINTFAASGVKG